MFLFYMKKYLRCPAFYVGALLLLASMIVGTRGYSDAAPLYLLQYTHDVGVMHYFILVAVALPICFVRHELDKQSAWQFPLMHASPIRYSLGGLFASCVCGALMILLAVALFFVYCVSFLNGPVDFQTSLLSGEEELYKGMPHQLVFGIIALNYAVNGAILASVAYGASSLTSNQYIIAATPFVLFIVVSFFINTLYVNTQLPCFIYLDPAHLTLGSRLELQSAIGLAYLAGYGGIVIAASGGLFHIRLKRRLRNG